MRRCRESVYTFIILIIAIITSAGFCADCNCSDYCSACQGPAPKYISATLSNLQGCPEDYQQAVSTIYPCFDNKTMTIVMKQDELNSCGYYYNGPTFTIDTFEFRLSFYLRLSGLQQNQTDFSIIVQENCGGWYDLYWSTASANQLCALSGTAEFSSLCNVPFPNIESGSVSWQPLILEDGNCPGCGDGNDIPENCDELNCENLDEYSIINGGQSYYYGPFLIYSPSECEKNSKTGNAIQTAKIVCPDAQIVSASAQSSTTDIIAIANNSGCQQGNAASFSIYALRGRGTVTLNATFYQKAYSNQCIAVKTTKSITIIVQPDPGDNCCSDKYKPVLLKGSPGNVSTPVRAGANPLDEWPRVNIYQLGTNTDVETIVPGRFTPFVFNNGKPPEYMRGWDLQIGSNAFIITNPENKKYIYDQTTNFKIHFIKNGQNRNIVEFIYDTNGMPIRQNDLTDSSLYISYHYNNGLLTEIREHDGATYRQYIIEYDNGRVSFVGGGCSQCGAIKGNRKYFYNPDGTIKYEKTIDNQILYEYGFDAKQRLTEKWLGAKQSNHPIEIINYTNNASGYIANIKEYVDNINYRAKQEYYTNSEIFTKQITCQQLNENITSPAGEIFTEEYIYDINSSTSRINKLTNIKPKPGSAKTKYIYDSNSGEITHKIAYDINNNPITILENTYQHFNLNGQIVTRILQGKDAYGANTYYQYTNASNYPSQILMPNGQLQTFSYDSEKKVIAHNYYDSNSAKLLSEILFRYDEFGNLISQTYKDGNDINDITEYHFDNFNEISRIKTAQGVVKGRSYDNYGRIISEYILADANDIGNPQPNLISQKYFTYNSNGLLEYEADAIDSGNFQFNCPAGKTFTKYEYDNQGRLIKIIEDVNGAGLESNFIYNSQGDLIKIIYPGGKWTEYVYDGRGLVVNKITGFGSQDIIVCQYDYDENGNCISQTDEDGTTSSAQYDEFDRIKVYYLPNGSFASYSYNMSGDITNQTLYDANNIALEQTVYNYDNWGRCTTIRQRQRCGVDNDTNDFVTIYSFDCRDNIIQKTIKANSISNDIITQFQFDGKNRISKIIDGMSKAKNFDYDKDDNIKTFTNELNLTSVNTYDHFGRLIKEQTAGGSYKVFSYNSLGRCMKETLFDSNNNEIQQKRYEYDSAGNVSKTIKMYDPANNGSANTSTDNIVIYGYDNLSGLLISKTAFHDSNQQAIEHYQYDNIGRLDSIIDAAGNSTKIIYDQNVPGRILGQLLTITDGNEQRIIPTQLKYDAGGRIIESRIDSNLVTQFFYDGTDRVVKIIKPGGYEILYGYDSFNNLRRITENGSITDYDFDRTGRLISAAAYDTNNQKITFEYDKNARVTKIIYPNGSNERFKYDALGKIIQKTLRSSDKIYYDYDNEGNLVWQSDDPNGPDGNIQDAEFLIEFEHNPLKLITYARKYYYGQIISESEFVYNGLGKIISETTSLFGLDPIIIEYQYDQAGNVKRQIAGWSSLNFTHDGLGRIKTINRNNSKISELKYLGETLEKEKLFEPGIEYTADFDEIGRINRCKSAQGTNFLLDFIYSYGNDSKRTKCVYNHIPDAPFSRYEYDTQGRLGYAEYTDGENEQFAYDSQGNRTTVETKYGFTDTYSQNNLDQYTKVHTDFNFFGFTTDYNLYWDNNGRLSANEVDNLQYEYDLLGNVTKASIDGQTAAEYYYDTLGRRIRCKTENSDTLYYYDISNRIAAEYKINQKGEPEFAAEYIYGNGFADVISKFEYEKAYDANILTRLREFCQAYLYNSGQTGFNSQYDYDSSGRIDLKDYSSFTLLYQRDFRERHWYYLKDVLGSTAAIIGGKYNRPEDRKFFNYDAFGKPDQASQNDSDFMFAGMIYDSQIGKYYCVNRYYDPDIGEFTTPDPLLLADGLNQYTYAENDPVMLTDRLGLKSSLIEEIQFLIGKGQIRTASKRLTLAIKRTCEQIDGDCKSRKCVAGMLNPNCGKAAKCFEMYRKAVEYDKQINSQCAKAAAMGTLVGTAQGLLNTVNGLQDLAISVANMGPGVWNSSGALIFDKQLEYIDSPDWSKDVVVNESTAVHEISKFLGSQGLLTILTSGGSATGKAASMANEGIYEFTSSSGRTYVGQSSNIPQRLMQHIKNGKLLANDYQTVRTTEVNGGRIAREIAEQSRIDRLGGIKNLENSRNAIGPGRDYLLQK